MQTETIYDIAGIGIGPFNLGLAALCQPIPGLSTIFLDQKPAFNWHEGMMIPGTTLQVSYLADLVTLADPSSKFSYLNYLRSNNRLLQFGIYEKNYIARSEYNRYCKWVCEQLDNLLFGVGVGSIFFDAASDCFEIFSKSACGATMPIIKARHIVVGIGSRPYIPAMIRPLLDERVIHSFDYMYYRNIITASEKVAVIGSGQSAAEIVYDQLSCRHPEQGSLTWVTRSDRFYAMEHSKLNYEMTSPDYISFFYGLDPRVKEALLNGQFPLYKGINHQLIDAIYDKLYQLDMEGQNLQVVIRTHSELKDISKTPGGQYSLLFNHIALKKNFGIESDFVILATGYKYELPGFLKPVKDLIQWDDKGRYKVGRNYSIDLGNRIFVQNTEMHTHGFNAPDLGLGAYRNAVILNNILSKKYYPVDEDTCFQFFGIP